MAEQRIIKFFIIILGVSFLAKKKYDATRDTAYVPLVSFMPVDNPINRPENINLLFLLIFSDKRMFNDHKVIAHVSPSVNVEPVTISQRDEVIPSETIRNIMGKSRLDAGTVFSAILHRIHADANAGKVKNIATRKSGVSETTK